MGKRNVLLNRWKGCISHSKFSVANQCTLLQRYFRIIGLLCILHLLPERRRHSKINCFCLVDCVVAIKINGSICIGAWKGGSSLAIHVICIHCNCIYVSNRGCASTHFSFIDRMPFANTFKTSAVGESQNNPLWRWSIGLLTQCYLCH